MKRTVASAIVFAFLGMGLALPALAQQVHEVKKGETLFSISKGYDITVEQLKSWNDLQKSGLEIGQKLIVQPPEETGKTVHLVEAQETLFSISKRYGVSIAEIKNWNNLTDSRLEVGQKLVLYPDGTGSDSSTESVVVDGQTRQNTYYTVKSGDTLYDIAREHGMTVSELKELNDLKSSKLAIGQRLTVHREGSSLPSVETPTGKSYPQGKFITYEVPRGSQVQDILERFRMDEDELKALNPEIPDSGPRAGQKITVLAPAAKSYGNPYLSRSGLKNLGTTPVTTYSNSSRGTPTTSGELYSPGELTAAHSNIALGTIIYIENTENQKGIYVRINDRISGSELKLSDKAWNDLQLTSTEPRVNIYQDQ